MNLSSHLFDPKDGTTIIEPPGNKTDGCWAGASSILFDEDSQSFYLTYRLREPRPLRGYIFYISQSKDGIHFDNIWQFTKEDVDSDSMEKGCLVKVSQDKWYLYISYVDRSDNKWRIDMLQASSPAKFNISTRVPVLTANTTNTEGVKDPVVLIVSNTLYMYYTFAHKVSDTITGMHDTGDILNTGLSKASTGIAQSVDGINFSLLGCALTSEDVNSWDWYCTRITAVIMNIGGIFIAYYDGAKTVAENYEEKLGVSASLDLSRFHKLSNVPIVTSPHGSHSIRYLSVCERNSALFFYYEYARQGGAHELRMNYLPL